MIKDTTNNVDIDTAKANNKKRPFYETSEVFEVTSTSLLIMEESEITLLEKDSALLSPVDRNRTTEVGTVENPAEVSALQKVKISRYRFWEKPNGLEKIDLAHELPNKGELYRPENDYTINEVQGTVQELGFPVDENGKKSETSSSMIRVMPSSESVQELENPEVSSRKSDNAISPLVDDESSAPCSFDNKLKQAVEGSLVIRKRIIGESSGEDKSKEKDPLADVNYNGFLHSSLGTAPVGHPRKKLLILDINGLLADLVSPPPKEYKADITIARRAVFKRPFCSEFLEFCFVRFDVGIWSSRTKKNVERVTDFLMGDMKQKLLFCWDVSHCTYSGVNTLENKHKALVFKELRKIWENDDADLPWEKGDYNESNTLLLDDSPYKALLNPPHTAIFPDSYKFQDGADNSLGLGGNIRVYLEELSAAENVQKYVEQHPFGQSAINESSSTWDFYSSILSTLNSLPPTT